MIFLGDLERYREAYSDRERSRNSNRSPSDLKRFEKAEHTYTLARLMLPDNGTFELNLGSTAILFFLALGPTDSFF